MSATTTEASNANSLQAELSRPLGVLQEDPENDEAWADLRQRALAKRSVECLPLLAAARRAHEMRREFEAVARLLDVEAAIAQGTPEEAPLVAELARVLDDEVFDDARALAAYARLLELRPGDLAAEEAIERSDAKKAKWQELVARYMAESKTSGDDGFRSSLLVSAAEVAFRYGRPQLEDEPLSLEVGGAGKSNRPRARKSMPPAGGTGAADTGAPRRPKIEALYEEIIRVLERARSIDPKNRRAVALLERVYRERGDFASLADRLEKYATEASSKEERVQAWVKVGRIASKRLGDPNRAMLAFENAIDLAPGHAEATRFLVDRFTEREMWEHLVAIYEEQLSSGRARANEVGVVFQIAMVQWKMRKRPELAEPYFERLRKVEPAHPGMLAFFREQLHQSGDLSRLTQVLSDAARAMPDGAERAALSSEIGHLAEETANSGKAIEQYRAVLRQNPGNDEARSALKRLYRQSASWNALADLLRGELERIPHTETATRLALLREIGAVYRDHIKSDSALVTVLTQIVQLDPADIHAVRELARVYDAIGRWRDLLVAQSRLAELEPDVGAKAEIYRQVARRWLEQFSNVQNATEAYEKLLEHSPRDQESFTKLRELYAKRRTYRPLYDLIARDAEGLPEGPARRAAWLEMAKLAAEKLDLGEDASSLFRKVLAEEPENAQALDALEKLAERDRDFSTVAEVLEKRVAAVQDPAAKLAVLLKLGAVYADRLKDTPGTLSTWQRVLVLSPGHAKAMRILRDTYLAAGDYDGLTELYSTGGDWEALAEVLSSAADKATDSEAKIELSFRAASVYAQKLRAPERAYRAYERVLAARPGDKRAAEALVPLYEKDEKWARLPALYEALLEHAENRVDQLVLYGKLARVTGTHLGERAASFAWARKAYEIASSDERTAESALARFEDAAKASGEWPGFVEALEARASEASAPTEKRALRIKIAEVLAGPIGDVDRAAETYRALVEANEHDEPVVAALDRLLRSSGRYEKLRALYDLRIARANTAARIQLLSEWAQLEEEALSSPANAIFTWRRLLDIVPQHGGALRALARLLRTSGDLEGAAEALERDRDQREGSERASREVELARLYAHSLQRPADALAAAKRALEIAPGDPAALGVIEELMQIPETRGKAASLLESSLGREGDAHRQVEALKVMIATAASKNDRVELYGRLADVYEHRMRDPDGAFEVLARAVTEFPSQLATWDRLNALASKTGKVQQFVDAITDAVPVSGDTGLPLTVEIDLSERAATLLDEMLGDAARAKPYLERVLRAQPGNERAFLRLKQILTSLEKWTELEALYDRAVNAAESRERKCELLTEVALVAEEIQGDAARAAVYYEKILEVVPREDPAHESALRSLDSLYSNAARWNDLARLLHRRLHGAPPDDAVPLKLRLGALLFSKLGEAGSALGFLEEVLTVEPTTREGREVVEKCLEIPQLRARAANILEEVYVAIDAVRELVRILEVRLETASDPADRRELLRRVAELRDERLNEGALGAYVRLVPLAPDDAQARARLLEIGKKLGAYEDVAAALDKSAEAATSPQPRAEILSELARVYEESIGDPGRAEATHKEVLAMDENDADLALPAARSLARLYLAGSQHEELAKVLQIEVRLEESTEARKAILGRLGTLYETNLGDPKSAIGAWKTRADDDPTDDEALAALDRLYEKTGDFRALVDVLRARERHTEDPTAKKALLGRIAVILAEKLGDIPEAILAYREIVDDFGASKELWSALVSLYEAAGRWKEVGETLEEQLASSDSERDRLELLARLGRTREEHTGDPMGAIEAYKEALLLEPSHAASRESLERMLEAPRTASGEGGGERDARREAAALLRPLYEADADQARLLRVLEIEIEFADSLDEKLALMMQAAAVAERGLGDADRAFRYAASALSVAAPSAEFPAWAKRTTELANTTGKHVELVALLRAVLPDLEDESLKGAVLGQIAVLARTRLADPVLAKEMFHRVLELRGDDREALIALEELHEDAAEHAELSLILERRADTAANDEEKRALLVKRARLLETLGESDKAIDVYEDLLASAPDADTFGALERLYRAAERWGDLASTYERALALTGVDGPKAQLHVALGDVFRIYVGDADRALSEYEEALKLVREQPAAVLALELLMTESATKARAAELLEPVYLARLEWRQVVKTLHVRLGASNDPEERRQLLGRLAKLHEEQEENYQAALEITAKLLAEDVSDEAVWGELERLARVAGAEGRLAEIFASELAKVTVDDPQTAKLALRTGELFEARGDRASALTFYRRAYDFAPEASPGAFRALDALFAKESRPADRVALWRGSIEHARSPEDQILILQKVGAIEEDELADPAAAIETFRHALDIDDADAVTQKTLSRLYAKTERWRDLADLLRRRAERSALPGEEAGLRLELGSLLDERLNEPEAAIDELRAVLELVDAHDPLGKEALLALEGRLHDPAHKAHVMELLKPVYERIDDWRKLAVLASERFSVTTDVSEKVSALREAGKLWEVRGNDPAKAFHSFKEAFVLDPDDGQTRSDLERLAAATMKWDELAEAYETGAAHTADAVGKKELLTALAKLHDQRRDDPRSALSAWERAWSVDEADEAPLEAMDSLATLLSDWPALVRVLAKKAELVGSDEERASTWRRIGEAQRDMLDDPGAAIAAYERALDLEPESTLTLDYLIALLEQKNDSARLVELYRRRIELCTDDDDGLRYQLLIDAASRYEIGLGDRREALSLLGDALEMRPGDRDVLKRLASLFEGEGMWIDLLENLRARVALEEDPAAQRDVQKQIARVLATHLGEEEQAIQAYRDVLEAGYDREASAALRALGEAREEHRAEVTGILEPVLRKAQRWDELVAVLELRLTSETDAAARLESLRTIARIAEHDLHDPPRALGALLRTVGDDVPEELYAEIERVAELAGEQGWKQYADLLADRAASLFDAEKSASLHVRLGRISEEKLRDDARAAESYARAGEKRGDDAAILSALDRLYGRLGEARLLGDVLERRIGLAGDDKGALTDLTHRLATLQLKEFGDRTTGLQTLQRALEIDPEHRPSREALESLLDVDDLFDVVFDALVSLYRTLGRSDAMARLFEKRVRRQPTASLRTAARLELARVLVDDVKEPALAQRVVEEAIGETPDDVSALAELLTLSATTGEWREAADALAGALEAFQAKTDADLSSAARAELWGKVASIRTEHLADSAGAEAALTSALAAEPESLSTLGALEALRRAPGREADLVVTLRRKARLAADEAEKQSIRREAYELASRALDGGAGECEAILREMLETDDGDCFALTELASWREKAGDFAEAVSLLATRVELEPDTEKARPLKHRMAAIVEANLGDKPRAIALYVELLADGENGASDEVAAARLRVLYAATGAREPLADLLARLVTQATDASTRSALRLELGQLEAERGAHGAAIAVYQAILADDPHQPSATAALATLYEKEGMYPALAALLESERSAAEGGGDVARVLDLSKRLGEIYESHLPDPAKAIAAFERVLDLDPKSPLALAKLAKVAEAAGEHAKAAGALERLLEEGEEAGPDGDAVSLARRLAAARAKSGDDEGVERAYRLGLARAVSDELRTLLRAHLEKAKRWEGLAALLVEDADRMAAAHPSAAMPGAPSVPPPRASLRPVPLGSQPPPALVDKPRAQIVAALRRAAEIHVKERSSPADAIPLLERATALVPDDRELLLTLCDALTASSREREATQVLEKVIASFGTRRSKDLALYHHRLGLALAKLGENSAALTQLDLAFKIDPGSIPVLRDLGVLALGAGDLERAQRTFRALLLQKLDAQAPITKGEVFFHLGEISLQQGDKPKAIQMYERAIENDAKLEKAKARLAEVKG